MVLIINKFKALASTVILSILINSSVSADHLQGKSKAEKDGYLKARVVDIPAGFKKIKISPATTVKTLNRDILENKNTKKILMLKVRKESFLNTIYNKLPWEDLLIGFQCKVIRNPNVYNVNFWYHFTNKYITSKYVRAKTNCNSCMSLIEYFDQNTYQVV